LSYSEDLLSHALFLLVRFDTPDGLGEVDLRRAVSACYYTVFHRLNSDAATMLAPNVSSKTNHRIQRWFDHGEMKKICGRFLPAKLDHPLRDLIGESASPDLQTVALGFIQLQDARHSADYDLSYALTEQIAWDIFEKATETTEAWNRLKDSAEANIFILSLLTWKNSDKDR